MKSSVYMAMTMYCAYKIAIPHYSMLMKVNYTGQKRSFSLRIFSENVTKSAVSCGFGHIY